MSERNNIDRLFQEKFKDFEVTPSDKVWDNIQLKMNTKEKKTNLLPFWLRLCSFAAVFLIGFSVATTFIAGPFGLKNPFVSPKENNLAPANKNVVHGQNANLNNDNITKHDVVEKSNQSNNTGIVNDNENSGANLNNNPIVSNSDTHTKISFSKTSFSSRNTLSNKTANSNNGFTILKKRKNTYHKNASSLKSNTLTSYESSKQNTFITTEESKTNSGLSQNYSEKNNSGSSVIKDKNVISSDNTIVTTETEGEDKYAENSKTMDFDTDFDANLSNSKVAHESGNKYIVSKIEKTAALANTSEKTKAIVSNNNNFITGTDKTKTNDVNKKIAPKASNPAISVTTDSLATNKKDVAKNPEEKKENEEKKVDNKKDKTSKWIVSSSFSPVYMNLNGSGSALDSKFANNSKSYQTSASYGVGLKYVINNKWTARTGLNVLNFDYSTNGITYFNSSNGAGLENVNENGVGSTIVIENPNPKDIAYDDSGIVTTRYTGNLNHKINYVELPLEMSYKILNKKFGIDVIGGFSTIFLKDNRVSLISAESNLNIGEANNLNKLHYSTNIGLGLRYSFMKNLQANLEPMFKYQINTYNGNAGNFKPYFMGVYSGISFSF